MTHPSSPSEIARKLTEAQTRALQLIGEDWTPGIRGNTSPHYLCGRGLLEKRFNRSGSQPRSEYRLTASGLAVRECLIEGDRHD